MISQKIKDEIISIVESEVDMANYTLFLFGSRAQDSEKVSSDIDIGIWGFSPLESITKNKIENKFQQSNIPYKIDFIDFYRVDESFKKLALTKVIVWINPQILKNLS